MQLLPDGPEWIQLEELIGIEKAWYGNKLSMLNLLLYHLHVLEIVLKVYEKDRCNGRHIKQAIAKDLQHRYTPTDVHHILNTATLLNPCIKKIDPFLNEEKINVKWKNVKLKLLHLAEDVEPENQSGQSSSDLEWW